MRPLVIIHGWSDEAASFEPLARALQSRLGRPVEHIWLGNYTSLDDDVQMPDLVSALDKAWTLRQLPTKARGADVIVHSTGALILRHWLQREYRERGRQAPVRNLVMLAPANFGSPLAHKGRAFYGRVLRGFDSDKLFETGTHILKALEMASPYTRDLADRDRFDKNPFNASGVRATAIIGNTGYEGIRAIANEKGSDGTIYLATANLDCARVSFDFASRPKRPRAGAIKQALGESAFVALDGHDHSSIGLKNPDHPGNRTLLEKIAKALSIENATGFKRWRAQCQGATERVLKRYARTNEDDKHGYQNTVFRVRDDQGFEVSDYVVEFYQDADLGDRDIFARLFNSGVVNKVHAYGDNPSCRSFMINCTELYRLIDEAGESLRISLSAMPDINQPRTLAGYRTFRSDDIGCLKLDARAVRRLFVPNRTLFVDVTLKREQKPALFTMDHPPR